MCFGNDIIFFYFQNKYFTIDNIFISLFCKQKPKTKITNHVFQKTKIYCKIKNQKPKSKIQKPKTKIQKLETKQTIITFMILVKIMIKFGLLKVNI